MSLSSDSCLKRIRQYVERAGYKEVSEERVREACLSNNFCPKDAANQLIKEEQLKIYLEDMCIRLGYQPIKAFISTSCTKYKFAQEQVEKYTLKLFEAKSKVLNECIKEKIMNKAFALLGESSTLELWDLVATGDPMEFYKVNKIGLT